MFRFRSITEIEMFWPSLPSITVCIKFRFKVTSCKENNEKCDVNGVEKGVMSGYLI